MAKNLLRSLKNNLFFILILASILIFSTTALATDSGREVLGARETRVEGEDNTLLLAADLANLDMDYRIEKIEQDENYYYIAYTYLDLVKKNNVWQYQLMEKTRKVTLKVSERTGLDLGVYLAGELAEEQAARLKELSRAQAIARAEGESKRVEVSQFTGLIGASLDFAGKIFSGYEPVAVREIPSPILPPQIAAADEAAPAGPDNLTRVYLDYIAANDPDEDGVFGQLDNCPLLSNPDQADADNNGLGDLCDLDDQTLAEATDASGTGMVAGESAGQAPVDDPEENLTPAPAVGEDGGLTPSVVDDNSPVDGVVPEIEEEENGLTSEPADNLNGPGLAEEPVVGEPTEPEVEIIELPN